MPSANKETAIQVNEIDPYIQSEEKVVLQLTNDIRGLLDGAVKIRELLMTDLREDPIIVTVGSMTEPSDEIDVDLTSRLHHALVHMAGNLTDQLNQLGRIDLVEEDWEVAKLYFPELEILIGDDQEQEYVQEDEPLLEPDLGEVLTASDSLPFLQLNDIETVDEEYIASLTRKIRGFITGALLCEQTLLDELWGIGIKVEIGRDHENRPIYQDFTRKIPHALLYLADLLTDQLRAIGEQNRVREDWKRAVRTFPDTTRFEFEEEEGDDAGV